MIGRMKVCSIWMCVWHTQISYLGRANSSWGQLKEARVNRRGEVRDYYTNQRTSILDMSRTQSLMMAAGQVSCQCQLWNCCHMPMSVDPPPTTQSQFELILSSSTPSPFEEGDRSTCPFSIKNRPERERNTTLFMSRSFPGKGMAQETFSLKNDHLHCSKQLGP